MNTELPRKTISLWEGWGPTGILRFSDASVWKRKLPIYFSKKWEKYCPSLCSPDHRETCPVVVQEVVGCSLGGTLRAAELQGHRPLAVPIHAGVRTLAIRSRNLWGSSTLKMLLQYILASRADPWFSVQKIKPIPGGQEFLLMERTKFTQCFACA